MKRIIIMMLLVPNSLICEERYVISAEKYPRRSLSLGIGFNIVSNKLMADSPIYGEYKYGTHALFGMKVCIYGIYPGVSIAPYFVNFAWNELKGEVVIASGDTILKFTGETSFHMPIGIEVTYDYAEFFPKSPVLPLVSVGLANYKWKFNTGLSQSYDGQRGGGRTSESASLGIFLGAGVEILSFPAYGIRVYARWHRIFNEGDKYTYGYEYGEEAWEKFTNSDDSILDFGMEIDGYLPLLPILGKRLKELRK